MRLLLTLELIKNFYLLGVILHCNKKLLCYHATAPIKLLYMTYQGAI